ncbi:TetR/AcrR family transcriptional regulator [Actinoplanes sp. KI2]|uniref:TetR/AcrR family transcriptional regulator n=1 Tax=Actinoplanes sp. KI2 TaxID=2983315 RepID=UPI0021D5AA07|nr:TetR/AcrR family transcriptional regulator [Actinoplanes sp. KI2]MCU7728662.1 TetR/AcrR family transcriptional regulator [Actinoplanes sp. KI2]
MHTGDTEARLIAAGVELLAEAGTDALSLREIARRAGVSHGAPRRYFPTHQTLLAAIAREGYRKLGRLVAETIGDSEADRREALLALGRRYVDFARTEPGMFALMFRHDLLRGNSIGLRDESTPLFGVLERLLQPTAAAAALWAALHGIAQLWSWGTMQLVTGVDTPEPLLIAAVDAHLKG